MNRPTGLAEWGMTAHAKMETVRRGIGIDLVTLVVTSPEQRFSHRPGRDVLQRRITLGDPPREYLVRAFVDVDRKPAVVVTVYLTSKITKYWRADR